MANMSLRWILALVCSAMLVKKNQSIPLCCKYGEACWPSEDAFGNLAKELSGEIVYANSSNPFHMYTYHEATSVSDDLFQSSPAAAMVPANLADVELIVSFLARHAVMQGKPLCVSLRGGGGSLIGRSSAGGGVHISMQKFQQIEFHTLETLPVVTVGGGANWGQVQAAANFHKRFLPTAECPKLGVGGFTQHGGGTVMSRSLGLVSDNLVAFTIVLPNGTSANISLPDSALTNFSPGVSNPGYATNADIWWAVRGGGGGNWGVITSFTFRTSPQPEHVLGMTCLFSLAPESIQTYFDLLPSVPHEWGFTAVLANIALPLGKYVGTVMVEGIYFGEWASGYPSVKTFVESHSECSVKNWTALGWWENLAEGAAGCELVQTGRVYASSILSQERHLVNSSGLAPLLYDFLAGAEGGSRICTPSQLGGKIAELKGTSGGAVSPFLRDALLDTACVTTWSKSDDDAKHITRMRNFSQVYHSGQYGQGTYIGEPLAELPTENVEWETAYWDTSTAADLRRVKRALDPLDVLHCDQCISPSRTATVSV